jgi:hypothetical protein
MSEAGSGRPCNGGATARILGKTCGEIKTMVRRSRNIRHFARTMGGGARGKGRTQGPEIAHRIPARRLRFAGLEARFLTNPAFQAA